MNSHPKNYCLKILQKMGNKFFDCIALPVLVKALEGVPLVDYLDSTEDIKVDQIVINRSVTEYEFRTAIAIDSHRVYWFDRPFKGGVTEEIFNDDDAAHWDYDDSYGNDVVTGKLSALRAYMKEQLMDTSGNAYNKRIGMMVPSFIICDTVLTHISSTY